MLKNQDQFIKLLNFEKGIEKDFQVIRENFLNLNLVHPFNIILEFINFSVENIKNEEQSYKIRLQHEEVRSFYPLAA